MAQNYTCDRCGKTIRAYSNTFNKIKFSRLIHEPRFNDNDPYEKKYENDLCDECMRGLADYIENPKKEEIK